MNVVVLGVGRSGTSVLTGLLGRMGLYVGEPHQLLQADAGNPRGYWERRDVVYLNRDLLRAAGADWHRFADLDLDRIDALRRRGFEARARGIAAELAPHQPWVLKDPRLCLLLPFWRPWLGAPACLLVYRSPAQVARSVAADHGLPIPEGLALWEGYTLAALRHSQGLPRRLVAHRELMARPLEALAGIHRDLVAWGVEGLRLPADEEVRGFLDPALFRQREPEERSLTPPQASLLAALADGSALASPPPPLSPSAGEILRRVPELSPPAPGLAAHGPDRELTPAERERYACRFRFPAGVVPAFEQGFEGGVETAGERLIIAVAGSPVLRLVPVGDDRFEIVGFGAGLAFQYALEGGRPTALDLLLEGGRTVIPMTLLPARPAAD